jgi:hypothetical protein
MLPSSESLEEFLDRVRSMNEALTKLRGAEVTDGKLIERLSTAAKDWLRMSQQLRGIDLAIAAVVETYDKAATELLNSTKARTRASSYQKKLNVMTEKFFDRVIVPMIKFEGSPAQVAARQIQSIFSGAISPEEEPYIEEAGRCTSVHCHRAALVLLWAAAMARFHTTIQRAGFNAFNIAQTTTVSKKGSPYNKVRSSGDVTSLADLQKIPDFTILVVGIELWKYDLQAFEELERLLGVRNSAAHPGMFVPNALEVQQFSIKLRRFVFDSIKL